MPHTSLSSSSKVACPLAEKPTRPLPPGLAMSTYSTLTRTTFSSPAVALSLALFLPLTVSNLTELQGLPLPPTLNLPTLNLPNCCMLNRSWRAHSVLDEQRIHASAVQLRRGALLLGGWAAWNTSSILTKSTTPLGLVRRWEAGPSLLGQGALYSCAVAIGEDRALLVGGILEPRQVFIKYWTLKAGNL